MPWDNLFTWENLDKIPSELHHDIEDQLLAATNPSNETLIRRRALESLGYSGRKEVTPLIEAAYQESKPDMGGQRPVCHGTLQ